MIYGLTKKRDVAEAWAKNKERLTALREMAANPLSRRLREYAEKKLKECDVFRGYDHFYFTEIICEGKPRWVQVTPSTYNLVWEVESST